MFLNVTGMFKLLKALLKYFCHHKFVDKTSNEREEID